MESIENGTTQLWELKSNNHIEEKFFNHERSRNLINIYRKYKTKIGTYEVKNMKQLWELVARDISNMYKITIAAAKCENRFKVLERNYKKFIDTNNKTGRGRKVFEFEQEFEEMFGGKVNVRPEILLASDTEVVVDIEEQPNIKSPTTNNLESSATQRQTMKRKRTRNAETSTYKKRNEILTDMKNDLRNYYNEKLQNDRQKLELDREKHKEKIRRTEILKQHLEYLKRST